MKSSRLSFRLSSKIRATSGSHHHRSPFTSCSDSHLFSLRFFSYGFLRKEETARSLFALLMGRASPITNGVSCPPTFSYRCALDCFLTMPVGFNIDLNLWIKTFSVSCSLLNSFFGFVSFFISNVRLSDTVKYYR